MEWLEGIALALLFFALLAAAIFFGGLGLDDGRDED